MIKLRAAMKALDKVKSLEAEISALKLARDGRTPVAQVKPLEMPVRISASPAPATAKPAAVAPQAAAGRPTPRQVRMDLFIAKQEAKLSRDRSNLAKYATMPEGEERLAFYEKNKHALFNTARRER